MNPIGPLFERCLESSSLTILPPQTMSPTSESSDVVGGISGLVTTKCTVSSDLAILESSLLGT